MANIFESLDNFRGDSAITTFAYRVAVNTCCNHVKKEVRESEVRSLDHDFSMDGVSFAYEAKMDFEAMMKFANTFKRIDRELILLYLIGEDQKSISEILGLSPSNVSTKLNRLKKKLTEFVKEGSAHGK